MRRVPTVVALILLAAPFVVVGSLVSPSAAHACTCAYPPGDPASITDSATGDGAVFVGTPVDEDDRTDAVYYQFDVRDVFRGDLGSTVEVATPPDSAACGTRLNLNREYIVFTTTYDTGDADWSMYSCSATTASSDTDVLDETVRVYGQPRAVETDSTPWPSIAVGAVIAVLLVAAAVSIWQLLRRRFSGGAR